MTAAELFTMATARHRAQRLWNYQQAALVWKPIEGQAALDEFIRCGHLGGGVPVHNPDSPEVQEHIERILANDGKFVMPEE